MKSLVTWHEECVMNSKVYLYERKRKNLADLHEIDTIAKDIAFRERQIARAKELGKDSYDESRFMKPKFRTI